MGEGGLGFKGPADFCLLVLSAACIFYVLGFASHGWTRYTPPFGSGYQQYGMWETCACVSTGDIKSDSSFASVDFAWFTATQVLITLGLIGVVACLCLIALYTYIPRLTKKPLLIGLIVGCFGSTLLMLIGIIIFGAESPGVGSVGSVTIPWGLHWGFAMTIIGMCFTCAAGVLGVLQLKQ